MDKQDWRKQCEQKRKLRGRLADGAGFSRQAAALIRRLRTKDVAAYYPFGAEPDLLPLLETLDKVEIPRLFAAGGHPLPFGSWGEHRRGEDWERPRLGAPAQPLRAIGTPVADLWLVPALAADYSGTRLGRGGGWYDRSLATVPNSVPVFAVVYSFELLPAGTLPVEVHDRPVDGVITESEVITF